MSLRLATLFLTVAGLSLYAWKDWFVSLCGLILIMAVIHHEDMPTSMLGIQGFNVWNILFLMIFLGWLSSRRREGLQRDMPGHVGGLLLLYLGVVVVGVLRVLIDRSHIEYYPVGALISEELINTIKWVLPGILLFDGCRTRKRAVMALTCILLVYLLLSVQVIKRMPLESALGGAGERIQRIRLKTCRSIGYSACDMSTILAGASWGMLAAAALVYKKRYKVLVLGAAGMIAFGQALTGGRAGYVAWGATGLVLCLLKWRKHLILVPIVVMLLPIVFPGATERMFYGFGETDVSGEAVVNEYEMTSGRLLVWPHVVDKIGESPLVGHGRMAMKRTGLTEFLGQAYGASEAFPHPHNMYLETLLDNGILGSIPIFLFWGMMLVYAASLFRSRNRLYSAVGGLALALMLSQLFAGIGAQHFYPRESTLCVWATMFLALRVHLEEKRAQMATSQNPAIQEAPVVAPEPAMAFAHAERTEAQ
ncbi:MAG: O-antigen ligase family protein [Phycisphaerales bacterium]|nr:MAG: O-antigen ligase family protein [Phycisphaerales bacterium]